MIVSIKQLAKDREDRAIETVTLLQNLGTLLQMVIHPMWSEPYLAMYPSRIAVEHAETMSTVMTWKKIHYKFPGDVYDKNGAFECHLQGICSNFSVSISGGHRVLLQEMLDLV